MYVSLLLCVYESSCSTHLKCSQNTEILFRVWIRNDLYSAVILDECPCFFLFICTVAAVAVDVVSHFTRFS